MKIPVTELVSAIPIAAIILDKNFNIVNVNDSFKNEFKSDPSGNFKNFVLSGGDDIFTKKPLPNNLQDKLIVDFGQGKREMECTVSQYDNQYLLIYMHHNIRHKEHLQQTIELQKSALRIHALTEKIRHIPLVISKILTINQEEEFFDSVSNYLTNEPEMGIKKIEFFIFKNKKLLNYDKNKGLCEFKDETEYPKIMKILSSKEPIFENQITYYSCLSGRQNVWGVIKITLDEYEVKLIFENSLIARGFIDSLESIAKVLGIFFDNLILYEKLEELSITDQLTGAYNRRFFDKKLKEELARAKRYKKDLALLMIDLDHLKEINDTYGHVVGDETIIKIANVFTSNLRNTDYLCRYGGDEFAIIMPETSGYDAFYKAELLRKLIALEDIVLPNGCSFNITVSIGVGEYTENVINEEDLIKKADTALYIAKNKGRNVVV